MGPLCQSVEGSRTGIGQGVSDGLEFGAGSRSSDRTTQRGPIDSSRTKSRLWSRTALRRAGVAVVLATCFADSGDCRTVRAYIAPLGLTIRQGGVCVSCKKKTGRRKHATKGCAGVGRNAKVRCRD
jgi:hypothetical protein